MQAVQYLRSLDPNIMTKRIIVTDPADPLAISVDTLEEAAVFVSVKKFTYTGNFLRLLPGSNEARENAGLGTVLDMTGEPIKHDSRCLVALRRPEDIIYRGGSLDGFNQAIRTLLFCPGEKCTGKIGAKRRKKRRSGADGIKSSFGLPPQEKQSRGIEYYTL